MVENPKADSDMESKQMFKYFTLIEDTTTDSEMNHGAAFFGWCSIRGTNAAGHHQRVGDRVGPQSDHAYHQGGPLPAGVHDQQVEPPDRAHIQGGDGHGGAHVQAPVDEGGGADQVRSDHRGAAQYDGNEGDDQVPRGGEDADTTHPHGGAAHVQAPHDEGGGDIRAVFVRYDAEPAQEHDDRHVEGGTSRVCQDDDPRQAVTHAKTRVRHEAHDDDDPHGPVYHDDRVENVGDVIEMPPEEPIGTVVEHPSPELGPAQEPGAGGTLEEQESDQPISAYLGGGGPSQKSSLQRGLHVISAPDLNQSDF